MTERRATSIVTWDWGSLERVELLSRLESELGVTLPESVVA
jgi:acyl carrier protein